MTSPFISDEAARKIGEAFADVMHRDMQVPSFMRVALEHQQKHPEKTPMQCMRDALPEYEEIQAKAFE